MSKEILDPWVLFCRSFPYVMRVCVRVRDVCARMCACVFVCARDTQIMMTVEFRGPHVYQCFMRRSTTRAGFMADMVARVCNCRSVPAKSRKTSMSGNRAKDMGTKSQAGRMPLSAHSCHGNARWPPPFRVQNAFKNFLYPFLSCMP